MRSSKKYLERAAGDYVTNQVVEVVGKIERMSVERGRHFEASAGRFGRRKTASSICTLAGCESPPENRGGMDPDASTTSCMISSNRMTYRRSTG